MANTCDPTAFKARFPEFATIDNARIQVFIDDALLVLNEVTWGSIYSLAVCYLSAHYLALGEESSSNGGGTVGNVSSKGVDGVTISYNSVNLSNVDQAYFLSTQYGQKFYSLIKSLGTMAFAV